MMKNLLLIFALLANVIKCQEELDKKKEDEPELLISNNTVDTTEQYQVDIMLDKSPTANVCYIENFELFQDANCTKPNEMEKSFLEQVLRKNRETIKSQECLYMSNEERRGVKTRQYCESETSFTNRVYNIEDEDPDCYNAYNSTAAYPSYTAEHMQCVRVFEETYAMYHISANNGSNSQSNFTDNDKDFSMDKMQNISFAGDNYSVSISHGMPEYGGNQMTTEMKFDNYFLYSIDNFGGSKNGAPPCGPDADYDHCADSTKSGESCCTHIVTQNGNNDQQNSFYRCMNYKLVDVGFKFEIDGMAMNMACTNKKDSGASYLIKVAFGTFTSIVVLMSI